MRLTVLSRYRSGDTVYAAGSVLDVTDAAGEYLMRDSPGTFQREDEESSTLGAMSTETETGLVVPDRRGRGGQRR